MAATQTQNDDLIILSDNVSPTFDDQPVIQQDTETNNLISFDWWDMSVSWGWSSSSSTWDDSSGSQVSWTTTTSTTTWSDDSSSSQSDQLVSDIQIESKQENTENTLDFSNSLFWDSKQEEVSSLNLTQTEDSTEVKPTIDSSMDSITESPAISLINNNTEETSTTEESQTEDTSKTSTIADIFWTNLNVENKPIQDDVKESKEEDTTSNLFSIKSSEETTDNLIQDENEDMNSIITWAIDKMKSRKWNISDKKSKKIWEVDDLEAKVKELKEKISSLKKEITSLDEETDKIDINIESLENMKLGKNPQILAAKTREHNTRKVIEKK